MIDKDLKNYIMHTDLANYLYNKYDISSSMQSYRCIFLSRIKSIYTHDKENIIYYNKKYFIKKTYVNMQEHLFNNSINLVEVQHDIENVINFKFKELTNHINKRTKTFGIPLFGINFRYISTTDRDYLLQQTKEVYLSNPIISDLFREKILTLFLGQLSSIRNIPRIVSNTMKDNNIPYYSKEAAGNWSNKSLYPKKSIDETFKLLFENGSIQLRNLSIKDYLKLNSTNLQHDYYTENEFRNLLKTNTITPRYTGHSITHKLNLLVDTNIKAIAFSLNPSKVFYSKKETNEIVEFLSKYKKLVDLKEKYNAPKLTTKILTKYKIEFLDKLPIISTLNGKKFHIFVHEENIPDIIQLANKTQKNRELQAVETIYEKFQIKRKYNKNKNEDKIPLTMKLVFKFIKQKSNTTKGTTRNSIVFNLYNFLCDNISKEIIGLQKSELHKLLRKLLLLSAEEATLNITLLEFVSFLNKQKEFENYNLHYKKLKVATPLKAYPLENFLHFSTALFDILNNNIFIEKLINNYSLSSALTYTFLHLCCAWRKSDMIENFPTPNLNLIKEGITPQEFLNFVKDGNRIDEATSILICKDIEEKVERFRKTTNKTGENLHFVISKPLAKHFALLLCIHNSNRLIKLAKSNRIKNINDFLSQEYTSGKTITRELKNNFGINLEDILGDSFDNRRANKSYITSIVEKAEEFGLAHAYYLGSITRSHKISRDKLLAEMTKIYIDKDISNSSLFAFASGSMGSIRYLLLSLLHPNFKYLDRVTKIQALKEVNLSPLEIETYHENLLKKGSDVHNFLSKLLTGQKQKEKFLKILLYDKNVYGKHEHTKCLFKILKTTENTVAGINICENSCPYRTESCIGCQYLIAFKYFIYELEGKYIEALNQINNSNSELDIAINTKRFEKFYLPLIYEMSDFFGVEKVKEMLDMGLYKKVAKKINGDN